MLSSHATYHELDLLKPNMLRQEKVRSSSVAGRAQEKFKHYRDLWRLNLDTYAWEQLPARGGPNARSGHRMAMHKDCIILFGGFHDNGNQTQ